MLTGRANAMTNGALTVLYTNIGRGHPFYLDGVVAEWARHGGDPAALERTDVFQSSGPLPRQLWKVMRSLYRLGSSPGPAAVLYHRIRSSSRLHHGGPWLRLAGMTLRSRFGRGPAPVLVAHPLLVSILAGRPGIYFQHGEVATPPQAVTPGAEIVFVPDEEAALPFIAGGYRRDQVVVTGLCIEPGIVAKADPAYAGRRARIEAGEPLTGAFFSSGAEPRRHVDYLTEAAGSAARAGHRALVFAAAGGALARRIARTPDHANVSFAGQARGPGPRELPQGVALVLYTSRADLDAQVTHSFDLFDFFVAPPHERTHWALGLGLPMFTLGPDIGPFAPLNHARLKRAGVARTIDSVRDAHGLGAELSASGARKKLLEMGERGFGTHPISGFARIAEFLARRVARATP